MNRILVTVIVCTVRMVRIITPIPKHKPKNSKSVSLCENAFFNNLNNEWKNGDESNPSGRKDHDDDMNFRRFALFNCFSFSKKKSFPRSVFHEPVSGWCLLIIPLGDGLWAFISSNFHSKPTWFTIHTIYIYYLVRKKWVKGISGALFPLTVIKWVCFISLSWCLANIFHNLKDFWAYTLHTHTCINPNTAIQQYEFMDSDMLLFLLDLRAMVVKGGRVASNDVTGKIFRGFICCFRSICLFN